MYKFINPNSSYMLILIIRTAFQSIGSDKEKDMLDPFQVMVSPSKQRNNGHTLDHSSPAQNIHTNVKPTHETSPLASNLDSNGQLSPETGSQHPNLDISRQLSLKTGSQGSKLDTNEQSSPDVPSLVQETNMKTAKTESKNKTSQSNRPGDK